MNSQILVGIIFVGLFASSSTNSIARDPKQGEVCQLRLDVNSEWPSLPPIIQDSKGKPLFPAGNFIDDDRVIIVAAGEDLKLSCSESTFQDYSGVEFTTATCIGGVNFAVKDTISGDDLGPNIFDKLGCKVQPDTQTFEPNEICGPNGEGVIVDIGFRTAPQPIVSEDMIQVSIKVCFDKSLSRTLYAYHVLEMENVARDTSNDRPSFRPDNYYNSFDVARAYTQEEQQNTIIKLVGDQGLGDSYVDPSSNRYLARGHLSPNADPVYYSWQDSTFYYLNVAPQWQSFNGQNWVEIENGARAFVEDNLVDLVIYTGTHDVLELADINNNPVKIYLNLNETAGNQLPVPKYYWKVLLDNKARTGVAFIGVNNPWIQTTDIAPLKSVCSNIISGHPVMSTIKSPDSIERGVTFACAVDDIAKSFPEIASIPELEGIGFLE